MPDINTVGVDWLVSEVDKLTDEVIRVSPVSFNEEKRYLPESVTPMPGYIRYDVNPYMREILECFDIESPVREVSLMKGVQITYSTLLESGLFYYAAHIGTLPMMYMSADRELALARLENNFLPMFQQSGFEGIIQSSDETSKRKTGATAKRLHFAGGSYLSLFGARNADKMRDAAICVMLKDEIDAWPDRVGKDGDPDSLSDDRCSAYWERRKIFRGSTPLLQDTSKIHKQYIRGDQRKYLVLCKSCGFAQELRWESVNKDTGVVSGFAWDMEDGTLIHESVRYLCQNCQTPHYEHDKELLFSTDHGAHWKPTAKPREPYIRSYHLPALYSPVGMQPWYKSVAMYLEGWDTQERRVKDVGKYQVFYNNILAKPFQVMGAKIRYDAVSEHRRMCYKYGEIPNTYAAKYSGSKILMVTCQVDMHKSFLAVAVMGWTRDLRCYLIDYFKFTAESANDSCEELSCKAWHELRKLIEDKVYTADDGERYRISITLIDAGYATSTVVKFCADYTSGIYPVLGRDRPSKSQSIREFADFVTKDGTIGYRIVVDHYKDRLAPILRREWSEGAGTQSGYHFNAPVDITKKQLEELTRETRRRRVDDKGTISYYWHRSGNARNELWDLLVYGHAAVEIVAHTLCIQHFELETVDWHRFWDLAEKEKIYCVKD